MTASNRSQIVKTMEMLLEGQMNRHRINIEVLLDKGVGVAEHPDIMDTIEKELGMMSEYADKLAMLEIVKSGKLSNGKSF